MIRLFLREIPSKTFLLFQRNLNLLQHKNKHCNTLCDFFIALDTRARKHLDFHFQVSSPIKNDIMCCNVYSSVKLNLNSFEIIKKS